MTPEKDHYAVLGVLPGAEDIVIRAAYRALAQRYHPDRFHGMRELAHARMSELNEAYAVLSDQQARKSYNHRRSATIDSGSSEFGETEATPPPGDDPLEKDWLIALKYYPDLAVLEKRISQFSWKLANTYRAYLLETKQFDTREALASLMEDHFLRIYFGDDEKCLSFARRLIVAKQRKAALALNETRRVLGRNADMRAIIAKIGRDFDIRHLTVDKKKISSLLAEANESVTHLISYSRLLSELGGQFEFTRDAHQPRNAAADNACKAEFDGKTFIFPSEYEFTLWFRKAVLPIAERLAR
jgi:curved DNA-binding protein CbpA